MFYIILKVISLSSKNGIKTALEKRGRCQLHEQDNNDNGDNPITRGKYRKNDKMSQSEEREG